MKKIISISILTIATALALSLLNASYIKTHLRNLGRTLTATDSPQKAELIICLTGRERLNKGLKLFKIGFAGTLLFTQEIFYNQALSAGVTTNQAYHTTKQARTTFEEALYCRDFIQHNNIQTVLVVSDAYHLYRVKWTFDHLLSHLPVELSYISSDTNYTPDTWWRYRKDRTFVLTELPKIIYYKVYYGWLGQKEAPKINWKLKSLYNKTLYRIENKLGSTF